MQVAIYTELCGMTWQWHKLKNKGLMKGTKDELRQKEWHHGLANGLIF